ncbi:MAG: aspartate--tRNA(Asn) ligase [Candidatus Diapherotrites archaeon]|nr:aspartate--tRNA(Asn) ligase [Candidatus Diapherotrites archaeon]
MAEAGWVSDVRVFGGLKFVKLRDRRGTVQLVFPKKAVSAELFDSVDSLSKESVVWAEGVAKKSAQAVGGMEVVPSQMKVLSQAEAPIPLDISGKIDSDLSARFDWRFLDLRQEKVRALFSVRSVFFRLVVDFFERNGFTCIQSPKLTSAGVESGAELFKVDYFGRPAYLAQSPQIYKQMMVAAGFERVFELGPVFRAEKSNTTRHVTEFTGLDMEMGFIESENDVMDVLEELFKDVLTRLPGACAKELEILGVSVQVPKKIPRIPLQEARNWLKSQGKVLPAEEDLDPEGEQMAGKWVKEKFGEEFVFLTRYPWIKRPFYHMKPEGEPGLTRSFDLLWNGLEVCTGAQREHRYEILKSQAKEKGLDLDSMADYAAIFRYGCPPHGGAGLGLDRLMAQLLHLENVKEAILLPRDPLRLTP